MTSISKLGRPYENGKALDVSTRRLVITDLIDGMSAKAVGKKYKLVPKLSRKPNTDTNKTELFLLRTENLPPEIQRNLTRMI